MSRPERTAPPELFYDEKEAVKYAHNSRMIHVQTTMAERCLELLNLPDDGQPRLLLDVGCGSGLSGDVLTEAGHTWIGLDISAPMLTVASENEVEGDLLLGDMGQGFGFRAGVFDGAISVSALQWLFYSDKRDHKSMKRLTQFFTCLYRSLRRGARAVLQIYPESAEQMELVTSVATSCGFTGGLLTDFPNSTKAKKHYLCLFAGRSGDEGAGGGAMPTARGLQPQGGATGGGHADGMGEGHDDDDDDDDDDMEAHDYDDGDDSEEGDGVSEGLRARRGHRVADGIHVGGRDDELVAGGRARGGAGASCGGVSAADWDAAVAGTVFEARRVHRKRSSSKRDMVPVKNKAWIEAKREARMHKGLETRRKSKYTGRKRSGKLY